jgi:DNA-binding NarL/FixJ family response regulator
VHRLTAFFATPRHGRAVPLPKSTDREHKVLFLIARCITIPEIARQLVLSPKTIRNHISNIFSKLQVADRSHAIIRARQARLSGDRA